MANSIDAATADPLDLSPPLLDDQEAIRGMMTSSDEELNEAPSRISPVLERDKRLSSASTLNLTLDALPEDLEPFELRMQFLVHLKKLSSSRRSIHAICDYVLHQPRAIYPHFYECLVDQLYESNANARLSFLYVLDALCQREPLEPVSIFRESVIRDLDAIISAVIYPGAGGQGNDKAMHVGPVIKLIQTWKRKNDIIPAARLESLESRFPLLTLSLSAVVEEAPPQTPHEPQTKTEVLKFMEDEREKHKLIKEEQWQRDYGKDKHGELEDLWKMIPAVDEATMSQWQSEWLQQRPPPQETRRKDEKPLSPPSKRAKQDAPQRNGQKQQIYVWDLDETLILFRSLLNSSNRQKKHLAEKMEELLYYLAEDFLYYKELSSFEQIHVRALASFDDQRDLSRHNFKYDALTMYSKQASSQRGASHSESQFKRERTLRYRSICQFYRSRKPLEDNFRSSKASDWSQCFDDLDRMVDRWLTRVLTHLKQLQGPHSVHICVASSHLVIALSKLLLFKLNSVIPPDCVYSAHKCGKKYCFDEIEERFGRHHDYLVIGNGKEEALAAEEMGWRFHLVERVEDVENVH